MRIEQLAQFLAVVDAGSMREAARRMALSQPAMSKSVRALEEELQSRLLQRTSRGIALTAAGRALASRARAIEAEWRKAREELAADGAEGGPGVALGIGQSSAMLVLPQALQRFRKLMPRTRLHIVEGLPDTLLPMVRDETLDFALGGAPAGRDPGIAFKPLFRSARVVVGRKQHPLRRARSLQELQQAEWIRTPPLDGGPGAPAGIIEGMFAAAGLAPPPTLVHCDSYHTATALLAASDMLALMSRRQLATPFAAAALTVFEVPHQAPAFTVGLFTRVDVPMSAPAAALARAVSAVGRSLAGTGEG